MKKKILGLVADTVGVVFFLCLCMLDSESSLPFIVAGVCGVGLIAGMLFAHCLDDDDDWTSRY